MSKQRRWRCLRFFRLRPSCGTRRAPPRTAPSCRSSSWCASRASSAGRLRRRSRRARSRRSACSTRPPKSRCWQTVSPRTATVPTRGSCARPYDSSSTPFRVAFAMSTGTQITAACRLAMASWRALVLERPPERMARHLDEVEVRAQGLPARPFVDRQDLHASLGGGATAGGIGAAPARPM